MLRSCRCASSLIMAIRAKGANIDKSKMKKWERGDGDVLDGSTDLRSSAFVLDESVSLGGTGRRRRRPVVVRDGSSRDILLTIRFEQI